MLQFHFNEYKYFDTCNIRWLVGATVARSTPDRKAGGSNPSLVMFLAFLLVAGCFVFSRLCCDFLFLVMVVVCVDGCFVSGKTTVLYTITSQSSQKGGTLPPLMCPEPKGPPGQLQGPRQTDRQTDRNLDTPTVGASSALPTMGHKDQLCLPCPPNPRPPNQPTLPTPAPQRCAATCGRAARLDL